jgi:hypothetical protein
MKKQRDQNQAIIDGLRLIEDLLIPQVTPRVPSHIRDRARDIMRNYPSESELKVMIDRTHQKENS